jgi:hypothetical protein
MPDEMIAVSDHLDSCSQPHPEVDDFGGVLPYIAESLEPVEPPAWLRESVIAAAGRTWRPAPRRQAVRIESWSRRHCVAAGQGTDFRARRRGSSPSGRGPISRRRRP